MVKPGNCPWQLPLSSSSLLRYPQEQDVTIDNFVTVSIPAVRHENVNWRRNIIYVHPKSVNHKPELVTPREPQGSLTTREGYTGWLKRSHDKMQFLNNRQTFS